MAESIVFSTTCKALEETSALSRIQARGTVRLVLRDAGLEPESVSSRQMQLAIEKLLPKELRRRALDESVCSKLLMRLQVLGDKDSGAHESPESVFSRMGGAF